MAAKIWPVYRWDPSPPVFALLVTTQAALDEMNFNGIPVTEGELGRALRDCGVETSKAGERLKAEIKAFYDSRKDRRIGKGTPPPTRPKRTIEFVDVFVRLGGRFEELGT